jgi:hypothetical protein
LTSATISGDGKQVAFVQTTGGIADLVIAGLRRVFCPQRNSVSEYAGEETDSRDLVQIRIMPANSAQPTRRNCMRPAERQYSDRNYARNFCAA